MSLQNLLKKITAMTTMFLCLVSCVGVTVSVPEKETYQQFNKEVTTRAWCGVTLWAVVVPIPLKLPVCELYKDQSLTTPFYACGPFMFMGHFVHGYEGYVLCGVFPR
jgi:hypothetical protein